MSVGDPRKAIVLAIIAVVFVTIAVFRSIPQSADRLATANRDSVVKDEPKPLGEATSTTPAVDAFSHPNLAVKGPIRTEARRPKPEPLAEPGTAPWDPSGGVVVGELPGAQRQADPAEKTGIDQQQKEKGVVLVRLAAIVRGDTALALIQVADGAPSPVAEGVTVNGHWKVLRIGESSVTVLAGGKERVIRVGEVVEL